ncbi:LacI family DNA-binding transcriptional regulator [Georgenia sunbinii]|uniref:LacI family DNA-binding transcriptional regulator n=1 Tax=Georgenia sunbinii TaxID=3117728 RepID=UPI002F25FE91
MHGRTRLADVADAAGVSTATVSRVLNGKPEVAADTRAAVLAALDQLGYERPERLRSRSAGLIGLIVPELTNPVFPAFAQSIESVLATLGYTPLLCTQSPGGTTEDQYIELLLDHDVDGIVFVSGMHADTRADVTRYKRLQSSQVPFVLINGYTGAVEAPAFSTDDVGSMDLAVRHLVSQGHRTLGLALGPERFVPVARKHSGFEAAVAAHLPDGVGHVVSTLFTAEGGQSAATVLIDQGCTAIICGSDLMALGAMRAARSLGMVVPRDLSVIGFDDSPLIAFTEPPLTTLRQPVDAMSRAAVTSLVAAVHGESVPARELLFGTELIVRDSTAAAPGRG